MFEINALQMNYRIAKNKSSIWNLEIRHPTRISHHAEKRFAGEEQFMARAPKKMANTPLTLRNIP
ncbi:MAG: hypothetical protein QM617_03995 [Comamonas sp.]